MDERKSDGQLRRRGLSGIGRLAPGCILVLLAGLPAVRAHHDFVAHMAVHLLLGMAGPALLAMAAPLAMLLRALDPAAARRLVRVLKCRIVAWTAHPVSAAILNVGGLWLLYYGGIYGLMHHSMLLRILIHVHLFMAGFVFAAAMLQIEPMPHRNAAPYRLTVLLLAMAAHDTLAKTLCIRPPSGIMPDQAVAAAQLMYYGGDAVDAMLLFMLCRQLLQTRTKAAIGRRWS